MTSRREFLKQGAALAALPFSSTLQTLASANDMSAPNSMIWGLLLHLGQKMWGDSPSAYTPPVDFMTWDDAFWEEVTENAAQNGLNMIVIDIGEAIQYESHPELATKGAWTIENSETIWRVLENLDWNQFLN